MKTSVDPDQLWGYTGFKNEIFLEKKRNEKSFKHSELIIIVVWPMLFFFDLC